MRNKNIKNKIESQFGGVYALFKEGVCVYIGESSNVPYRLQQHYKEGVKDFDDFRVYRSDNRKALEADLIQIFRPKYNIVGNPDVGYKFGEDLMEQGNLLKNKVDKAVSLLKATHNPIKCGREDLRRVFTTEYGSRPPYKEIIKKYGGYLGEGPEGEIYDLLIVLKFKKEIQQELFEYAFAHDFARI